LTDGPRNLDRLAKAAKDAGAQCFGGGPLFLMPSAQKIFLPFIEEHFPELAPRYRATYRNSAYLSQDYKRDLAERVRRTRERYGLESRPVEYRPELADDPDQGVLFAM